MKTKATSVETDVEISFQLIRNVTSPEEKQNGIMTYFANIPAYELRHVDTVENLRDYIPGSDPDSFKKGKRNTVHKAIERTIEVYPDRFINRNGGITITCSKLAVDDKNHLVRLENPSVINGAQTRGEILRHRRSLLVDDSSDGFPASPFNVRAEIIVDPDHASVVETAIARNTASPVKSISQAGGRGQLDELDAVMLKATGKHIQKSETDPGDLVDTFLLLQSTRLLMPFSVSKSETATEILRPYKQRALCLEDFTHWYEHKSKNEDDAERYRFVLQMAPIALAEYVHWQNGSMWNGKGIRAEAKAQSGQPKQRSFKRGSTKEIVWVAPGVVFPILSAMREFVVEKNGVWCLEKPEIFEEEELVEAAIDQWRGSDNNPMWMGRSAAVYSALRHITRTSRRAAERMKA